MFLTIQTANETFISTDNGQEYASLDDARAVASQSALAIATSEIGAGKTISSVEATLLDSSGNPVERLVASISVARLMMPKRELN